MGKAIPTIASRPYEQNRRAELEYQLSRIRICYIVFYTISTIAAAEYLEISPAVLIFFSFTALLYGFARYFKPADISENRHLPPAIDWLDLLYIAFLIYLTGGIKSFFQVAYTIPVCSSIIRFGWKAGAISYAAVLGLTVLMYLIYFGSPLAPLQSHILAPFLPHIIVGMGTLAFVAWMVSLSTEKEWELRDEMYLSSITDHLSGLYNSSYLRARINEEIEHCRRGNLSFALSFIDLDNFKLVNDQYGHLVGDKLLKQIADTLVENIRKGDVLARYGGDEFVLLMPGTKIEQAETIMKRIEDAVAASAFTKNIKIGLSNGIVIFPEDGDSPDKLLTSADGRMYEQKKGG